MRLVVTYPRDWETDIDESAVRRHAEPAFEFHFIRRPQMEARLRLPEGQLVSTMDHAALLETYWKTMEINETESLNQLAAEIIQEVDSGDNEQIWLADDSRIDTPTAEGHASLDNL